MPPYSLADLAKLADVSPRTVRYYIATGLLPGADFAGPATRYDDSHLARLRLIRGLQKENRPLADIRRLLGAVSDEEAVQAVETRSMEEPGSALDYIRSVVGTPALAPRATMPQEPAQPAKSAPSGQPVPQVATRSQWDRIALDPDIELHVRRPLSRPQHKRVERLITLARQLFEEE